MCIEIIQCAKHCLGARDSTFDEIIWLEGDKMLLQFLKQLFLFLKFFKDFIYLFLEREEWKGKEGEKHQCTVASHAPPTGDLAQNPGMCSDWELNQWPFGSQACTQSTELH